MKKISFNITQLELDTLQKLAEQEQRTITDMSREFWLDSLKGYHPFVAHSLDTGQEIVIREGRIFFKDNLK